MARRNNQKILAATYASAHIVYPAIAEEARASAQFGARPHVVRARSFTTEVVQDDAGVKILVR